MQRDFLASDKNKQMDAHIRNFSEVKADKFDDEGHETLTGNEQVRIILHSMFLRFYLHSSLVSFKIKVENLVEKCYDRFEQLSSMDPTLPYFYRKEHIRFLERSLRFLSTGYECLDSSRPWMVYWILQAAHLLNFKFSSEVLSDVVEFLSSCRYVNGGFGGGPGQLPHLAPTYAAVLSLSLIESEEAHEAIDM